MKIDLIKMQEKMVLILQKDPVIKCVKWNHYSLLCKVERGSFSRSLVY